MSARLNNTRSELARPGVAVNFKQTKVQLFISQHWHPAVFMSTFFQWLHKTKQRAVELNGGFPKGHCPSVTRQQTRALHVTVLNAITKL